MSSYTYTRLHSPLLWAIWVGATLLLLGCDDAPQVGVIGTGNAGRVAGTVKLGEQGIFAATRLLQVRNDGANVLVKSQSTDSSGAFLYDSVFAGVYYIEAWQNGQLCGKSDEFEIAGSSKEIVVVLLKPAVVNIDLRSLGEVDSVYLDYPENQARKIDSIWSISAPFGDSGLLYTRTVDAIGSPIWLTWKLSENRNRLSLVKGSASSTPQITSIDTSFYFPNIHTMALWTFDTLGPDGIIRDLSPFHNDFIMPQGDYLTPSPHNHALAIHKLPKMPFSYIAKDTIPKSLRWWESEFQTVKIRMKVDAAPATGTTQIFGTHNGFRIGINQALQIIVLARIQVDPGAWDWNTFTTPVGTLETGKWFDFAITRSNFNQTFSAWKNNQPIPVYANVGPFGTLFKQVPLDTFSLCSNRWSMAGGQIFVDEIEVSDNKPFSSDYSTQSTSRVFKDVQNGEMIALGISENKPLNSISIDSSNTITIGSSQSLFLRLTDYTNIFDRDPILAQLNIRFSDSKPPTDFAVFEVYPSFNSKLDSLKRPVAGLDYRSTPESIGYAMQGEFDYVKFDITSLVNKWARDTTTNHGIIIMPIDKTQPSRQIDLSSNKEAWWSSLIVWIP